MRRLLIPSLFLFLLPSCAFAQSVRYQSQVIGSRGTPLAFQFVAVCTQPANTTTTPCSTLATLATSNATTSGGTNPLLTDINGNFFFYAAPGRYTIQIYGPAIVTPFVQADTEIFCTTSTACTITGAITLSSPLVITATTNQLVLGTAPNQNTINSPAPSGGISTNLPTTPATGTVVTIPQTVASGTAAMTSALIGSLACGSTVTVSAPGVATTDSITYSFNATVNSATGTLIIVSWPTAGNVNFQYCNPQAGNQTPTAATLNWKVVR
jgi:hypothetical protein